MNDFFSGVGVIVSLELRQRVRGRAWYVLLGIFVGLIALVTVLLTIALGATSANAASGGAIFSTIIYFVLLLGTLVAPALGGNAINGDRDAGTLATTQVTLVSTGQIVIGKFIAAWITALGFLAVSVPFLLYSALLGGLSGAAIAVSILVLAVELGVVSAIGVGLSGLLNRPLFSIVATYLVVASLSIGTLIVFGLGGLVAQTPQTSSRTDGTSYDSNGVATECGPTTKQVSSVPRFDYFWGVLSANPYVLLADAVPTHYDSRGNVTDLFGTIKAGVRAVQIPPEDTITYDSCSLAASPGTDPSPVARTIIESTLPVWAVGLLIQLALSAAALAGAVVRTKTPAGRLSRGSRIA
ncbi:ABC transporter permease [Lacisediminihabitans sp. H27-G8]|uniref:ABC transporter permease n=1 Tax=Lacisediminihabitans sp. H27-G8 TaxID=3111909 RepID=UPI0038FC15AD